MYLVHGEPSLDDSLSHAVLVRVNIPSSSYCWTQVCVPDAQWGQTNQNSRVWSRERFISGPSKKNRWLVLKRLEGFGGEEFLKAKFWMRATGCVTFFWLVNGEVKRWCFRNLVLSLKLPSSIWVGDLVPVEELKDILLCISLEEELGLCFITLLLFDAFSLFLHSLTSMINNCLNLHFGNQGRSRKLQPFSYQ